ncbi:hypothetical protein IC582_004445 [Cucumis melo]|uniref:protein-serine/threonine phosphatase n=2 Tax=Cucumis melo TaxID=3656 RepID=A0A5A7TJA0_CUCMM|nr:putative protein phosphatase 2C 24 [Cucumis melo var. makuwa]TYK24313.1 putative protein phosphatase 2C 24 [Cucumis melo var. makuwa]
MDFLHLKDASTTADDSNRSSSSSSSSGGRKRCRMHSVSRRCENEDHENRGQRNDDDDDDDDEDNVVVDDDVKYGVTSVCGRRREMEDMVSVHLYFTNQKNLPQIPIHFFGVFDGHGCSHVSMSCMNRMHEIVKEEIDEKELGETEEWKKIMRRSFRRMDEEVMEYANKIKQRDAAVAGSSSSSSQNNSCRCELQTPSRYDTVGSTALVLLLMPHKLIIANCGDSRAVLSRKTTGIFPLSSDHKPDRPDELSRIESGGGHVIYWEGARVLGVLAMSRAIGDSSLKPYVIPEPEVVIMDRRMEDEFIILATDGLWDVVTNETACDVVRACMQAQQPSVGSMGGGSDKTCSDASILLTKLAIAKRSSDNISIVVIDLGTHHQHHHC